MHATGLADKPGQALDARETRRSRGRGMSETNLPPPRPWLTVAHSGLDGPVRRSLYILGYSPPDLPEAPQAVATVAPSTRVCFLCPPASLRAPSTLSTRSNWGLLTDGRSGGQSGDQDTPHLALLIPPCFVRTLAKLARGSNPPTTFTMRACMCDARAAL